MKGSLSDPAEIALAEADWDDTVYLIQDITGEDDNRILAHYCDMICEDQIARWWTDKDD